MNHKNTRRGKTQDVIIGQVKPNNKIIPELVSGSSTHAVTQEQQPALTKPKPVRQFCLFHNGGFTLIELLVVVLIIGILAAVALPQYQKVVKRAQGREVLVALDALDKAQALYYQGHGYYGCDGSGAVVGPDCNVYREDLEIEIPRLKYFQYSSGGYADQFQYSSYDPYSFVAYIKHSSSDMLVSARWYKGEIISITCRTRGQALVGECNKYFECKEEWESEEPDFLPEDMKHYEHKCLLAGEWQ